jgi:hypothetical protein
MLSVIGIHAKSTGAGSLSKGADEGHAWLTLHYPNGQNESVGLWPVGDGSGQMQPRHFIRDPIGIRSDTEEKFDVVFGIERRKHYIPSASRYYGLYSNQSTKAIMSIGKFTGWRITHNCATWATEKIAEIFGVRLASQEFLGLTNTPRRLGQALRKLEAIEPTSISNPKYAK